MHWPGKKATRHDCSRTANTSACDARQHHVSTASSAAIRCPWAPPFVARGVNFSIFSKHATSCCLLLFDPGNPEPVATLPLDPHTHRTGQVWHVFVEGLDVGAHYGYRFSMEPNPDPGVFRFNASTRA